MIGILQNLVVALSANADIKVVLIALLFGLMVVGLVLGQELAFVLGGAGVLIGAIAMGDSGVTIAMTKIYDQMQSYSMVAIPMFVLMANFLTHSKVADRWLFIRITYHIRKELPSVKQQGVHHAFRSMCGRLGFCRDTDL